MAYDSVPQISARYLDGNFDIIAATSQPSVLVLGTATDGRTDSLYRVGSISQASAEFKNTGTLIKGLYEVSVAGANNVWLRRLATGTPAVLTGVGSDDGSDGITITTVQEDNDAGDRYSIWFTASDGRLAIYDNEDEEWIYDTAEILAIDTGLISVEGVHVLGEGVDIGTQSGPVAMSECEDIDVALSYTAGTDGDAPSFMELYEALEEAYEELDWQKLDFIVPMKATLDAPNIETLTSSQITTLGLDGLTDYPTAGGTKDYLGRLFKQEYNGSYYYWWDMDNDGVAEIYPSVGSASATTDIDGETLTSSDFHEVNFAYQLAEFCRKASTTWHTCIGFVGVEGPDGFDKASLAAWIGKLPTYTEMNDGSIVVSTTANNGTGLLGNKFLAGKKDFRGSVKDGGFIKTDSGFLDGTEELDANNRVIDIGKHIVIAPMYWVHVNKYVSPTSTLGRPVPYLGGTATTIAGKYATLIESEEANGLNGLLKGGRLDGIKIPGRLLSALNSIRYVCIKTEPPVGIVASGSKTAARPESDYAKISTIRSVNRELRGLRSILFKFQGKPFNPTTESSISTLTDSFLSSEREIGINNGARFYLTSTQAQRILGQLKGKLKMVPPLAIESIDIEVSLTDDPSTL